MKTERLRDDREDYQKVISKLEKEEKFFKENSRFYKGDDKQNDEIELVENLNKQKIVEKTVKIVFKTLSKRDILKAIKKLKINENMDMEENDEEILNFFKLMRLAPPKVALDIL